ncbi:MAG: hypothetical protein HOJ35_05865 [Bdellovibrionales bacterium]|jgi:hypothetical protein|nr:hypothetical protein [Bdellovibrionales bacterium]
MKILLLTTLLLLSFNIFAIENINNVNLAQNLNSLVALPLAPSATINTSKLSSVLNGIDPSALTNFNSALSDASSRLKLKDKYPCLEGVSDSKFNNFRSDLEHLVLKKLERIDRNFLGVRKFTPPTLTTDQKASQQLNASLQGKVLSGFMMNNRLAAIKLNIAAVTPVESSIVGDTSTGSTPSTPDYSNLVLTAKDFKGEYDTETNKKECKIQVAPGEWKAITSATSYLHTPCAMIATTEVENPLDTGSAEPNIDSDDNSGGTASSGCNPKWWKKIVYKDAIERVMAAGIVTKPTTREVQAKVDTAISLSAFQAIDTSALNNTLQLIQTNPEMLNNLINNTSLQEVNLPGIEIPPVGPGTF